MGKSVCCPCYRVLWVVVPLFSLGQLKLLTLAIKLALQPFLARIEMQIQSKKHLSQFGCYACSSSNSRFSIPRGIPSSFSQRPFAQYQILQSHYKLGPGLREALGAIISGLPVKYQLDP